MTKYILSVTLILGIVSCNVNKANIDDTLGRYFDSRKVEGCFTLLNNADGKITVYNMSLDTQRFSPFSTFKIVSSLIGLQTGAIKDTDMIIPWDGIRRRAEWNKNMTMKEAFQVSNVPYFQEVVKKVGLDTMKHWMETLSYGNMKVAEPLDSVWINNTLQISPDEQLGLLKKLYFDQLPFRKSVQEQVRNLMLQEDDTRYRLSYKTGNGMDESNRQIAWVCGWIEENNHVYFFVSLLRTPDTAIDMKATGLNLTRDVLKEYGFFEGKK